MVIEEEIIATAQKGVVDPQALATTYNIDLATVQQTLISAGIDWAETKHAGRPRTPLLPGQQLYVERAYRAKRSQAHISTRVRASLPRIKRHLQSIELFPSQNINSVRQSRQRRIMQAIDLYLNSVPVLQICRVTNIRPPALYDELRARNIPLRVKKAERTI